jgi:hypothetical protein
MTKFYAQEKQVFDINKVTVVGSPTITSDGVASGFSSANNIKLPNLIPTTSANIHIKIVFNINEVTTSERSLFGQELDASKGFQISVMSNNTLRWVASNSSQGDIFSRIVPNFNFVNGEYLLEIIWNGTTYSLIINGELKDSFNSTTPVISNQKYYIGNRGNLSVPFTIGSIDLSQFSITVDGELVYSPTKPVYALERRKPTVWNKGQFTIVGNPSISESGVASGFSGTSYLTYKPFTYSTSLEIYFAVTPNGNGKLDGILGSFESTTYRGIKLDNTSGNTFRLWLSSDGVNNDICNAKTGNATNLTNNVLNYFRLIWDGTTYKLQHSLDKKFWNDVIVVASSLKINTSYSWIIGGTAKSDRLYGALINGSINLKQFKIYTDNNLVFDGGADTYVYDASKFTVVGSPTITEYGVVNGFSANNYIIIPNYIANKDNFKITGKWICGAINETILGLTGQGWDSVLRTWDGNRGLVCGLTNTSLSTNSGNCVIGRAYDFSIEYQNNSLILGLSTDGGNFVYVSATEQTLNAFVNSSANIYIGVIADHKESLYMKGSIFLPSFSITVDGKEVFTGAKEKFYAMRGM